MLQMTRRNGNFAPLRRVAWACPRTSWPGITQEPAILLQKRARLRFLQYTSAADRSLVITFVPRNV